MTVSEKMPAAPCSVIVPARSEKHKTVCVLGAPRGGTSMVAGILRKLGVPMGGDIDPANNEDREFQSHDGRRDIFEDIRLKSTKEQYLGRMQDVVTQRNRQYDVWGWKDPIASIYVDDLAKHLRNLVFIVTTRDVGAVAQRERIEAGQTLHHDLLAHIDVAIDAYRRCFDIIRRHERPALLVSYERALRSPRAFGRAIVDMIGVDPPIGFGEWLDDYVGADKLDGAVDLPAGRTRQSALNGSSGAVRAVIAESARLRREGFHLKGVAHEDLEVVANERYRSSVAALLAGHYEEGQHHAQEIVGIFSEKYPQLADGPIGLLTHEAAAVGGATPYPDVVCGALYIIGLSSLLLASVRNAFLYLKIAESIMADRLRAWPQHSLLSRGNYGSCVFHLAHSATAMRRFDVVDYALAILDRKSVRKLECEVADIDRWAARARAELVDAGASGNEIKGADVAVTI